MVTSDFRLEVEIRQVRAWAMYPAIMEQFVHYGRGYGADTMHVPQNAFLVNFGFPTA